MPGRLTKILEVAAHGGPSVAVMGTDNHMKTPTAAGRYIIYSVSKHVSYGKYSYWSGVAWGTPLRFTNNITEVQVNGVWKRLSSVNNSWGQYKNSEQALTDLIKKEYSNYSVAYKNANLDKWIFNDFGHISVKYFKDVNHNGKRDGKESVMGDFIHTTPPDEALNYYNKHTSASQQVRIDLAESHGCIHVKPDDIDDLISKGYLHRGNGVEVHPYSERTIPTALTRRYTGKFFELHFYPGLLKAVIYGVS